MPKASNDLILRDRLQFDFASGGDRTTLYGRLDLSDYVNVVKKDGLSIKEIMIQPRLPTGEDGAGQQTLTNTGVFFPFMSGAAIASSSDEYSALKIYATTRAYQNATDVGIASPDVLCVEEYVSFYQNSAGNTNEGFGMTHTRYGPKDLHPDGFLVVSDLLIGVAADNVENGNLGDITCELDIMLIAEPVKITQTRLDELLAQAQDL